MSYATMFEVPDSGELRSVYQYGNSWLGAMRWWRTLGEHYEPGPGAKDLHVPDFDFMRDCVMPLDEEPMTRIWKLAAHPEILAHHRAVLKVTFDRCIVRAEDISRLSGDLLKFVAEFGTEGTGHATVIARDLVQVRSLEKKEFVGVCFNWTSVTDAWTVYGEAEDDSRLYDVSRDSGHWFLYQESEAAP